MNKKDIMQMVYNQCKKTLTNIIKQPKTLEVDKYYKVRIESETLFGYFVKYNDIVGLIHKSKANEKLEIGEVVNALLISIKEKKNKKLYSFSLRANSTSLQYSKTIKQCDCRVGIILKREKTKMCIRIEGTNVNGVVSDNRFFNLYRRKYKDGQQINIVFKHYDGHRDKLYFALDGWKPKL